MIFEVYKTYILQISYIFIYCRNMQLLFGSSKQKNLNIKEWRLVETLKVSVQFMQLIPLFKTFLIEIYI